MSFVPRLLLPVVLLAGCGPVAPDTGPDTGMGLGEVEEKVGCYSVSAGPRAFWRMNEASGTLVIDSSGFAANATYTNGPTACAGMVSNGHCFDGVNDFAIGAYNWGPDISTEDFTLSAWVNQTAGAQGGVRVILDRRDTTGVGYEFYLYNGRPGVQLADSSGYTNYVGSTVVTAGTFQHVVVSVARAGNINFYVNGAAAGSTAAGHPGSLSNPVGFTLGRLKNSLGSYFRGTLDEVRVSRAAWTAADAAGAYGAGSFGTCN